MQRKAAADIVRRAGLTFNPLMPRLSTGRSRTSMSFAAFGLLPSKRLWEKARRVAHRTWATVPRDRSRVGQCGSQSRGAEEQRGIGARFFRPFLCVFKEMDPGARGTESPQEAFEEGRRRRPTDTPSPIPPYPLPPPPGTASSCRRWRAAPSPRRRHPARPWSSARPRPPRPSAASGRRHRR